MPVPTGNRAVLNLVVNYGLSIIDPASLRQVVASGGSLGLGFIISTLAREKMTGAQCEGRTMRFFSDLIVQS